MSVCTCELFRINIIVTSLDGDVNRFLVLGSVVWTVDLILLWLICHTVAINPPFDYTNWAVKLLGNLTGTHAINVQLLNVPGQFFNRAHAVSFSSASIASVNAVSLPLNECVLLYVVPQYQTPSLMM
jgi:hypothetical protein